MYYNLKIFILLISACNLGIISSYQSTINLTINGNGEHQFLNYSYQSKPSRLIIDGKLLNKSDNDKYVLNNDFNNNVTLIFDEQLESCEYMFSGIKQIIEIDLSNFDSSKVKSMKSMFNGCSNLTKITFGKINTSSVVDMSFLFYGCEKITSLDLSNFDTSLVTNMTFMFKWCKSLISIDVSKFNTSNVENMYDLFASCEKLISLNLSKFDTSKVTNMQGMFYHCFDLKYIDISNFNISLVQNMIRLFTGVNSLIYVNFANAKLDNAANTTNIFLNANSVIKFCINDNQTQTKFKQIDNSMIFDCSDICFQQNIKIDSGAKNCIKSCNESSNISYIYEYNNICYNKCPYDTYPSINNQYLCLSEKPDRHYLDLNESIYKECYNTCQKCNEKGDEESNKCIECINGFIFLYDSLNIKNCFKKCEYYYYFDNSNKYHCTLNFTCQEEYNKLIPKKRKCIDNCNKDDTYIYEYNNICYDKQLSFFNVTDEKDKDIYSFRELINNSDIIENIIESKQDVVKNEINVTYQITTSENQKNNNNNNISKINLGKCENILRDIYDINYTLPLIIFKIDYFPPNTLIPLVGYEIYHPKNKSKLNLSYCKDELIKLNIPAFIDENELFKYEPDSDFYNDGCFSYTTTNGTDIILIDRKKEFNEKNLSLCENGCDYLEYNKENKQSSCECIIKNKMELISQIIDEPNNLANNFDLNDSNSGFSSTNMITIKCTKALFSKEGLKYNISSYILLIFITYFLLSIILFMKCGYYLLENDISEIIKIKVKNEKEQNQIKRQTTTAKSNNINRSKFQKVTSRTKFSFPPKKNNLKKGNFIKLDSIDKNNNQMNKNSKIIIKNQVNVSNLYKNNNNKKNSIRKVNNNNKNNKLKQVNISSKISYNDYELNTFSYKESIKYDKRACGGYFLSLIKTKHPIIFAFFPIKDYNLLIIKLGIFCLSFSVYYVVNFLFFDDNTLHAIYEKGGSYDIIYFLPKIFISFVISHFISIIVKIIFLSERNIIKVRKQQSSTKADEIAPKVKREIVIKYIIFFILGIIFLFLFWMFLSSFGAVYQNTQLIIFENTIICFVISFIYPFIINLLPSIFRTISINNKSEYLYSFSKILQHL